MPAGWFRSAQAAPAARLGAATFASLILHGVLLQPFALAPGSGVARTSPALPLLHAHLDAFAADATPDTRPASGAPHSAAPAPAPANRASVASAARQSAGSVEAIAEERPGTAPRYYLPSELDRAPRPLAEINPEYPPAVRSRHGYLGLRLFINKSGRVDRAQILVSDPPGVFDASAVSAFAAARFSPGMRRGMPEKSRIAIELKYEPKN